MIGAFNRLPFNRPTLAEVLGAFIIQLVNDVQPGFNMDMVGGGFTVPITAEVTFEPVPRDQPTGFTINANLTSDFSANRYRIDVIEINGNFAPGDQIVIDMERLRMTLNGQNTLHLMQGDFFRLHPGKNELIYTDDQTGRTVRMRVTFRDRYV